MERTNVLDRIHVLNRIIEAENNAQALAGEALQKREHLSESLAKECEALREDYMRRANERVKSEIAMENANAEKIIAGLEARLIDDLSDVDRKLTARRGELAAMIFSMILENEA